MRRRALSKRDQLHVERLIREICDMLYLDRNVPDFINIGWTGFLEVYRNQPDSFLGSGRRGWYAAAQVIYERLAREKAALDFVRFKQTSLDLPVPAEVPIPRVAMLRAPNGDFQNSVCFRSYLRDIEQDSLDAAFLARRFIEGDSLEEVRQLNHWDPRRAYQALYSLRGAMEEYARI